MPETDWSIVTDDIGRVVECTVGGVGDVAADVEAVGFFATPAERPAVTLYLRKGVQLAGFGVVNAVAAGSARGPILEWLATLDASTLESDALEDMGMGDSTGAAFLRVLRAYAEVLP